MADAFAARLHLEAVGVRYGAERAVDRVDCTARAGEFVVLVGPNGSGKSSLLRAVAGLQRHEGLVRLEGAPAAAIGFMPQDNGAPCARSASRFRRPNSTARSPRSTGLGSRIFRHAA